MAREPVVAGQFYPAGRKDLLHALEGMLTEGPDKVDAIGVVSPHAGYMYSGKVAGDVYSRLQPKDTYIIISPNHTGSGGPFAVSLEQWDTPLGRVDIDAGMADSIISGTSLVREDPKAHAFEHSIEVQLPFIQIVSPDARIVPLTVRGGSRAEYAEVAGAIVNAVKGSPGNVLIVASSDMTHYESRSSAREKDMKAIRHVLDIDPEGLLDVVELCNISMCGYIPTAIMLMCARELGATGTDLVKYTDSGEVTGNTEQVVGYAGIIVY